MSAAGQIVEIVDKSIGALARLDADELEALESSLAELVSGDVAGTKNPKPLRSNHDLVARIELLGRCVAMTAANLQVLERLALQRTQPADVRKKKGV